MAAQGPAQISHAPIPGTLPRHHALKNPARNPQDSVSLFVFSFSEVLAFHRHSRSLLGIFKIFYSSLRSQVSALFSILQVRGTHPRKG